MAGTLGREVISTRQRKIAELAQREPKLTLTTLAHHVDEVWMREAYRRTRKDAAAGVDGVTAAQYEADLVLYRTLSRQVLPDCTERISHNAPPSSDAMSCGPNCVKPLRGSFAALRPSG